jgi:pimeloyl-[acyl-carrier protein] methyl ester esterase
VTSTLLVLAHGWAFDRNVWGRLTGALRRESPGVEVLALDQGFFGRPAGPGLALPGGPADPAGSTAAVPGWRALRTTFRRIVGVGHSLGFLRLLSDQDLAVDGLVSLAGFPRFARGEDFPEGVHPRMVRRMAERLAADPAALLQDFHAVCGLTAEPKNDPLRPHGPPDRPRLALGLGLLLDLDRRDRLAALARSIPVLALASADDTIVPEALTRPGQTALRLVDAGAPAKAKPGISLELRPDGGHGLPLTRPGWCAARIAAWLDSLDAAPDPAGAAAP